MNTTSWIIIGVIALVLIIAIIAIIAIYNQLVKLRNNNEEAFSTMDVYMKKRYDLIPNLVNTVKGYAKHEKETLENVVAARNVAMGAKTANDKINAEKNLSGMLSKLMMVVENYPDLKADSGFLDLQNQLQNLESEIANARKFYNGNVKAYNNKIMVFPSNMIASMFKFNKVSMFEITSNEEREAVKVEF